VSEVMTVLGWTALTLFIIVDAILPCNLTSFNQPPSISTVEECQLLTSSATDVVVLVLIWLNNISTLINYLSRANLYPIICPEQLLFFNQVIRGDPEQVVVSFAKWNKLKNENEESIFDCFHSPRFLLIQNLVMLFVLDIAGLGSVSNVFKSDDTSYTIKYTLPFIVVVVCDFISKALLYKYHDRYLCHKKPLDKNGVIAICNAIQVAVSLTWTGLLAYLIFRVKVGPDDCLTDKCTCSIYDMVNGTMCQIK